MDPNKVMMWIGAVMLIILALILITPFCYEPGTFIGLDGRASTIDRDWSGYGAGGIIYSLGDLVCHQEESRTLILNGNEMAICIRDLAMLIGFVAGCAISLLTGERFLDRKALIAALIMFALTPLEWVAEQITDLDSSALRLVLGIVSGIGIAVLLRTFLRKMGPEPLEV
ncbi:MAG: DUF2085 domain-containing protein [Thermoplasmata archaeon]|nr:DUF2085 domain-containing protein [Thermoplasmata archaeon]